MLPKINRLKKRKDFERVFKKGTGFKDGLLFIKIIKNNQKLSRFGFMVGKKVSKKAVTRNRIRRRLREQVRIKLPKIKKGVDIIIVGLSGLGTKDFCEIEMSLNKILEKAKIINE